MKRINTRNKPARKLKWSKHHDLIMERIRRIREVATELGYDESYMKEREAVIRFERDGKRFDVFFTTMTVAIFEYNEIMREIRPRFLCVSEPYELADII